MKTIFIALILFIFFRIGNFISVPFLLTQTDVSDFVSNLSRTGVLNVQALKRMSLFSLGIVPYVTSGIVVQLLKFVFSDTQYGISLKNKDYLSKNTILIMFFLATFQSFMFVRFSSTVDTSFFENMCSVIFLVAGSFITVWIAKIITSFGFGNGASILIMLSIIEYLKVSVSDFFFSFSGGQLQPVEFFAHLFYVFLLFAIIIIVELSFRPINLIYPSTRFRDGFHKGKKSDILPLKINNAGVLPLIFAMSFTAFLSTFILPTVFNFYELDLTIFMSLITVILISFFVFFYTPFVVNTEEMSNNLKKSNIILEKYRPGSTTKNYLDSIINKLNYISIIYLSFMVMIPDILQVYGMNVIVSGVSTIILVAVVIDIVRRMQYLTYSNKSKTIMH